MLSGSVEKREELLGGLPVHLGNRFQLLYRGFPDLIHTFEVSQELFLPLPSNTGDFIQEGVKIALVF